MSDPVSIVEYMGERLIAGKPIWNTDLIPCDTGDPAMMLLVADFDARRKPPRLAVARPRRGRRGGQPGDAADDRV
jgi:hypothetical protein